MTSAEEPGHGPSSDDKVGARTGPTSDADCTQVQRNEAPDGTVYAVQGGNQFVFNLRGLVPHRLERSRTEAPVGALDGLSTSDASDPRIRLVIRRLADHVIQRADVAKVLTDAGLNPDYYSSGPARVAWAAAVPDAILLGVWQQLVAVLRQLDPAFVEDLERSAQQMHGSLQNDTTGAWYCIDNPYECRFIGPRAGRAMVDRAQLRANLRELAVEDYRVLVVNGEPRSGKSHTWLLVDHLRSTADELHGHRFARVTSHGWSDRVSGEAMANALADRLGLDINLMFTSESAETRVRKWLDKMVGRYPQADGVTRWVVLDGLDRPNVDESARDFARGLLKLVRDGDLPRTRLIVTGLDRRAADGGNLAVRYEDIPRIDHVLVSTFIADVASHLERMVTSPDVDAMVLRVLGPEGTVRDLEEIEGLLFDAVKEWWAKGDRVAN